MTRRSFVIGGTLALGACVQTAQVPVEPLAPAVPPDVLAMYAALPSEEYPVPAIDPSVVEPRFWRQVVADPTGEPAGTITVDTNERFLHLSLGGGQAMRYGIGVGKEGLAFAGRATIARKAAWPRWTPTANMIRREPERYGPYAGGLPGGLENPLGARALYLYEGGRDTLYRIHGTNEPWSIGRAVSSGCIRLFNQDIIDLHRRVPTGTRVMVLAHTPGEVLG
ncbi:L,D-transpeptidase [Salinarimonas ramus]|uniref:L,D-transpeptidase n=1 Tax=Salinarimonas ramus TaxID=690164 RepID=A0A917QAD3_9HYPH|nr:L,D-transpeptidase [Salinarimonas ramus]GGK40060.1 L,D-transpeptidase [Salinarimonas ramus]